MSTSLNNEAKHVVLLDDDLPYHEETPMLNEVVIRVCVHNNNHFLVTLII
jgi:hypothetical protein